MRRTTTSFLRRGEIAVDVFAGGGGASTGIEQGLTRPLDIAINHSPEAIAVHQANHPATKHYLSDVWEVDPCTAADGRPVGLVWFSPACTFFSRARGGKPVSQQSRCLAWVVVRWAKAVRPRVIMLENVEEFAKWGPLDAQNSPIKKLAGKTFRAWVAKLRSYGYAIEWRSLVAADYGAPTTRRRLFLIARCDGAPIVWPEPTHGKGRALPWRTAAEIIDWSRDCPSIFDRKRPLAPATLRRIAAGIARYVLGSAKPFVIKYHGGRDKSEWRGQGVDEPIRTVDTNNRFALVTPSFVLPVTHPNDARVHSVEDPLRTVTGANRGELALATAFLAPVRSHGGGGNDAAGLDAPLRTVTCTKRGEFAVVTPFLARTAHGERDAKGHKRGRGHVGAQEPLPTVCASGGDFAVVAPFVARIDMPQSNAACVYDARDPLRTITTAHGGGFGACAAFLAKHYGGVVGHGVERPLGTVTAVDHHALATAFLAKLYGTSTGVDVGEPVPTVTAGGGHLAEVRALLARHDGAGDGTVEIDGERYAIVDIGMRMLSPAELFGAQGFPADYAIAPQFKGKRLTKTAQIKLAGNSVPPQLARALVEANAGHAATRVA